jgi:hypothetical protein
VTKPSPTDVRAASQVPFDTLGFSDDSTLQRLIDVVWGWLGWATGQVLATWTDATLEPVATEIIARKVGALAYASKADQIETIADFKLISSFSAGSYSETRRSIQELRDASLIDADPFVNEYLWPLMTLEKRDEWWGWLTGKNPPAFEVTEMIWDGDPLRLDRVSEWESWSMYF